MAGRGDVEPSGFGPALRRNREAKGWTQQQLGEAAGIHPNTVAKLERGDQEPNWPLVLKLAEALEVTCEAFSEPTAESEEETGDGREPLTPVRKPSKRKRSPKR